MRRKSHICLGPVWTAMVIPAGNWRSAVAVAPNTFVIAGLEAGTADLITSRTTDGGATWSVPLHPFPGAGSMVTLSFGNGKLFIDVNALNYITSADGGLTWQSAATHPTTGVTSQTFGDGVFYTFPGGTSQILTSADLVAWSTASMTPSVHDYPVAAATNHIVAALWDGGAIFSNDGVTFNNAASTWPSDSWARMAVDPTTLVALRVNQTDTNSIRTSQDGNIWTVHSVPNAGGGINWAGIGFGQGMFYTLPENGVNTMAVSIDKGVTWAISPNVMPNNTSRWSVTASDGVGAYIALNSFVTGATNGARGIC